MSLLKSKFLMPYGGSHLLSEFLGLGILMGMKSSARVVHKDVARNELLGISSN
jgi:hypothetical protein